MTKADLLRLLEPYGLDEPIVFVCFDDGIVVHEEVTVTKDHCTARLLPDGGIVMPVAIYLSGEGRQGQGGAMGQTSPPGKKT